MQNNFDANKTKSQLTEDTKTFSLLPGHKTAENTASPGQKLLMIAISILILLCLLFNWRVTIYSLVAILTSIYFLDVFFNLFLVFRGFRYHAEINFLGSDLSSMNSADLPTYTIFCPLYKEWQVLPQFVSAIEKLDYPKAKLQVMLLLEEDDEDTISRAQSMDLPNYFEIVVVPHSQPKTKPKAMNYGLSLAAGEYITIYDAEDIPDPQQLKKAVLAFNRLGSKVVCVQSKLNFYNPNQNFLTKLFTAEYSLWFDLVLPGLQSFNAPIPLGGTSNHFRTAYLRRLQGWDAFNVTEDCELGMRLAKEGYSTAIIDSTTYEEANSNVKNWYRQRSRWIKGYIQTYFVHARDLTEFKKDWKEPHLYMFQLIVGGKVLSTLLNPLLWAVTFAYFAFRSHVAPYIEPFFPSWVLYLGVFSLVFGNFLYIYYYMLGLTKRSQDGLILYVFLVPFYWLGMSLAAYKALYEVVYRPHFWEKTVHGLHINSGQGLLLPELVKQPVYSNSSAMRESSRENYDYYLEWHPRVSIRERIKEKLSQEAEEGDGKKYRKARKPLTERV